MEKAEKTLKVKISVDCEELDIAIKKIEQLAELLREVQQVVDSMPGLAQYCPFLHNGVLLD